MCQVQPKPYNPLMLASEQFMVRHSSIGHEFPLAFTRFSLIQKELTRVADVKWTVADVLERFGSGGRYSRTGELFVLWREPFGPKMYLHSLNPNLITSLRAQNQSADCVYLPWAWSGRLIVAVEKGARRLTQDEALADAVGNPLLRF